MSIKKIHRPGIVTHTFNPSTQESGAGGSLSSKLVWLTYEALCQPEYTQTHIYMHAHMYVHTAETLSQRKREELRGAGGKEEQMMKERNSQ